jgi:hypothetical protein
MGVVVFALGSACDDQTTSRSPSPSSSTSSSASSGGATGGACENTGFCSPSTDTCACGTSCVHGSVGSYFCGFTCTTDDDCAKKTNPANGNRYTRCSTGTYDNFCAGEVDGDTCAYECWETTDRCDCKLGETTPSDGTKVTNCGTKPTRRYCCQYATRCGCDDNEGCGAGGVVVDVCKNDYCP